MVISPVLEAEIVDGVDMEVARCKEEPQRRVRSTRRRLSVVLRDLDVEGHARLYAIWHDDVEGLALKLDCDGSEGG